MIRLAAVGDVHVGDEPDEALAADFAGLGDCADALLLAGDLTRCGTRRETALLAEILERVPGPVVAVLGTHDHHADDDADVVDCLTSVGVTVLEGDTTPLERDGTSVGIAGSKGFGGGFVGASASDFGEPEMKAFVRHTKAIAERLRDGLAGLDTDHRVALLHYSPVAATLHGEPPEIFPFLGSYLLAEAVDDAGADLVIHGHAHRGSERGVTPGGVRVRNVARPLIGSSFRLFELT